MGFHAPESSQVKHGKYTNPRTTSQNALFHLWCNRGKRSNLLSAARKTAPQGKHQARCFKSHLLGHEDIQVGSKTLQRRTQKHQKAVDKGRFQHFMEQCEEWLISQGVALTILADSEYMKLSREARVSMRYGAEC